MMLWCIQYLVFAMSKRILLVASMAGGMSLKVANFCRSDTSLPYSSAFRTQEVKIIMVAKIITLTVVGLYGLYNQYHPSRLSTHWNGFIDCTLMYAVLCDSFLFIVCLHFIDLCMCGKSDAAVIVGQLVIAAAVHTAHVLQ